MSQWSLGQPRACLNDANRGRFSAVEPKAENNPFSRGPAGYNPNVEFARKQTPSSRVGCVFLRPIRGETEREQALSDGTLIRHILPAGPGSYEVGSTLLNGELSPTRHRSPQRDAARARSPPFGGAAAQRSSPPVERAPAPGAYDTDAALRKASNKPTSPTLPLGQSPRGVAEGPGVWRCGVSLAPTSPRTSYTGARRQTNAAPRTARGDAASTPAAAGSRTRAPAPAPPGLSSQQLPKPKGGTFTRTPRNFNLHNVNSFTPRERDADFAHPPPGWYAPKGSHNPRTQRLVGCFSKTPRVIDLSNKTPAPGPGTYNPMTKDIVQRDYTLV